MLNFMLTENVLLVDQREMTQCGKWMQFKIWDFREWSKGTQQLLIEIPLKHSLTGLKAVQEPVIILYISTFLRSKNKIVSKCIGSHYSGKQFVIYCDLYGAFEMKKCDFQRINVQPHTCMSQIMKGLLAQNASEVFFQIGLYIVYRTQLIHVHHLFKFLGKKV